MPPCSNAGARFISCAGHAVVAVSSLLRPVKAVARISCSACGLLKSRRSDEVQAHDVEITDKVKAADVEISGGGGAWDPALLTGKKFRKPDPLHPPAHLILRLLLDFSEAGEPGSIERHAFEYTLVQDLSHASGTPCACFEITAIAPGSKQVYLKIFEDNDLAGLYLHPRPAATALFLQKQVEVKDSMLRKGRITSHADSIQITGRSEYEYGAQFAYVKFLKDADVSSREHDAEKENENKKNAGNKKNWAAFISSIPTMRIMPSAVEKEKTQISRRKKTIDSSEEHEDEAMDNEVEEGNGNEKSGRNKKGWVSCGKQSRQEKEIDSDEEEDGSGEEAEERGFKKRREWRGMFGEKGKKQDKDSDSSEEEEGSGKEEEERGSAKQRKGRTWWGGADMKNKIQRRQKDSRNFSWGEKEEEESGRMKRSKSTTWWGRSFNGIKQTQGLKKSIDSWEEREDEEEVVEEEEEEECRRAEKDRQKKRPKKAAKKDDSSDEHSDSDSADEKPAKKATPAKKETLKKATAKYQFSDEDSHLEDEKPQAAKMAAPVKKKEGPTKAAKKDVDSGRKMSSKSNKVVKDSSPRENRNRGAMGKRNKEPEAFRAKNVQNDDKRDRERQRKRERLRESPSENENESGSASLRESHEECKSRRETKQELKEGRKGRKEENIQNVNQGPSPPLTATLLRAPLQDRRNVLSPRRESYNVSRGCRDGNIGSNYTPSSKVEAKYVDVSAPTYSTARLTSSIGPRYSHPAFSLPSGSPLRHVGGVDAGHTGKEEVLRMKEKAEKRQEEERRERGRLQEQRAAMERLHKKEATFKNTGNRSGAGSKSESIHYDLSGTDGEMDRERWLLALGEKTHTRACACIHATHT